MATFKIKNDKAKHLVQIHTLDETHKKIMVSFQNRKKKLPNQKRKLQQLKNVLSKLETSNGTNFIATDIKKRSELKTEISQLEENIYDAENDVSEIEYYSKTEDIIMDYYDIIDKDDNILYSENPELGEEKKVNNDKETKPDKLDMLNLLNINKRKPKKITKKRRKKNVGDVRADILKYFDGNSIMNPETFTTVSESDLTESNLCDFAGSDQHNDNERHKNSTESESSFLNKTKNKAELLDQYMMLVNSDYMCDKKRTGGKIKICFNCGIEKTLNHSEGIFVCQECGEVEMVIIDSDKPNYKESITDTKPGYPYKRINVGPEKHSYKIHQGTVFWKIVVILVIVKVLKSRC